METSMKAIWQIMPGWQRPISGRQDGRKEKGKYEDNSQGKNDTEKGKKILLH